MIRSMTGYGRGEHLSHNRRFVVEIKSVNHRYNEITIKLPRFLNALEDPVRKRLSGEIGRGKTDVYIFYETYASRDVAVKINAAFADAYVEALRALAGAYALPDGLTLSLVASHPEIITVDKDHYDETAQAELWETLLFALEEAIIKFNKMRETEGSALRLDILEKQVRIRSLLIQIKERAPLVAEDYAKRLQERITEALTSASIVPDESRLLTEIAVFADRSNIDEELTRLESHICQMEIILNTPEAAGRKLDFLIQEINREINTIGSKSNDLEISKHVVELKSEVEKIREQIQNIE